MVNMIRRALLLAALLPCPALAQTATTFKPDSTISSSAVNTAFGGKRDFKLTTPDDFKQATDPDDTLSFSRYIAWVRTNSVKQWTLSPGHNYSVSASLDLTGFSGEFFDFNGSTITGANGLSVVIDALGTANSNFRRGTVECGSQGTPCTRGIQFGRYTNSQGYPQNTFDGMTVDGYYTQAAVLNNGSELFNAISPQFFNRYTASGCSKTALDSCGYALIEDAVNHWPITSNYVTVNLTQNTFESFNENTFHKPVMVNYGNGPALWMSGSHRFQFQRGYIQVQGTGAIPAAILYSTTGSGEGVFQHLLDWDVHSEIQPSSIFFVTGNANPAFFGMRINDHLVQSNKLFETDAGVASVRVYGADWNMTGFVNTTALFDSPSKFQIDGNVFMFQESAALWNGPAYSGIIHTNARSNFESGMTQGAGAFLISDPFGSDSVGVQPVGPFNIQGGKIQLGTDLTNQNLGLGNGSSANTPYIDFNGNSHTSSVRLFNDADGNLTISSDGTTNVQVRKTQPTLFNNGITSVQQVSVNNGGIILGSDSTNQNLELGNGAGGTTPYADFNGNGVATNVRLLNDADGNLSIQSDGTTNMQVRKTLQTLFNKGITSPQAISGASFNSTSGYVFASLPAASGYPTSGMVYCTNCLKPGESTGSGTGIWLFTDGSGNWFSTAGTAAAH